MFGSGVPVLAVYFPTLVELVRHGENGIIFHDSVELTQSIMRLLFPKDQFPKVTGDRIAESPLQELTRLKEATSRVENWDVSWDRIMRPIVQDILSATSDR
jgi:beta-1,4-mannosyltransferase